jgi:hypothetical protein
VRKVFGINHAALFVEMLPTLQPAMLYVVISDMLFFGLYYVAVNIPDNIASNYKMNKE